MAAGERSAWGETLTETNQPDGEDRILVKVGTPFATLDLRAFGVVIRLFDDDTVADLELRTRCLALMQNNTMLVAPARLIAAGVLALRPLEVKL